MMRMFWRWLLPVFCGLMLAACSGVGLRLPGDGVGAGQQIEIGTVGDKRYQIKGLVVRTSTPVCDLPAYLAGFKNGLVNRWDTNVMLDRLPKRYYLDIPPENLNTYASQDGICQRKSAADGESDGDKIGKNCIGSFYRIFQKSNRLFLLIGKLRQQFCVAQLGCFIDIQRLL